MDHVNELVLKSMGLSWEGWCGGGGVARRPYVEAQGDAGACIRLDAYQTMPSLP